MDTTGSDIVKFSKLVSCDRKMKEIFDLIEKAAPTDTTVLILGESGTGKELIARAIYEKSRRAGKPFIAVNCSAVPDDLIESHLFGHSKGSFTGASADMEGQFKLADGGTLFLDEIGDMSLKMQAKILRVLEAHEIQPIGSNRNMKVDVRVIAATNKNLEEAVAKKEFRADLYFRISEIVLNVPPLRERMNDLHLILMEMIEEYNKEFGRKVSSITLAALGLLQKHTWPGNIRELRNVIKRTMVFINESTEQIFAEHLPIQINSTAANGGDPGAGHNGETAIFDFSAALPDATDPDKLLCLEDIESRYIKFVLKAVKNNKTRAARILKIDRTTLYEKINKYKIESEEA